MDIDRDVLEHLDDTAAIGGGDVLDRQHRLRRRRLLLVLDMVHRDQRLV